MPSFLPVKPPLSHCAIVSNTELLLLQVCSLHLIAAACRFKVSSWAFCLILWPLSISIGHVHMLPVTIWKLSGFWRPSGTSSGVPESSCAAGEAERI